MSRAHLALLVLAGCADDIDCREALPRVAEECGIGTSGLPLDQQTSCPIAPNQNDPIWMTCTPGGARSAVSFMRDGERGLLVYASGGACEWRKCQ